MIAAGARDPTLGDLRRGFSVRYASGMIALLLILTVAAVALGPHLATVVPLSALVTLAALAALDVAETAGTTAAGTATRSPATRTPPPA